MTKISGSRDILINLGIIVLFILIAYAFLFPLIEGKKLKTPDITHFQGMSKELVDYRNETGEEALWTNSMFGGMPAYMISVLYKGNLASSVHRTIQRTFSTAAKIILYLIGFYILLLSLGIKRWLSVAGAIAFGLSSYLIIILAAGHNSKADAIGYITIVIASVILAFRGKYLVGGLLMAAAFSLELQSYHFQITYYGFLMLVVYAIIQFFYSFKEKELGKFFKATLYLTAGIIVALGMNFSRLYTTWEYSKETIRGPSELTSNSENKTSGLDKDYVVQWSQGISETLTILIPNFMGGSSLTNPTTKGETYQLLRENNIERSREILRAISLYHGDKPSTAGPYYFGAFVVFLFILGLIVVKGPLKWWLLIITILSVLMAWGKNFMEFTSFLLDYLPMYNKFRAPEMTLVIAMIAFPLLGFLGLNKILNRAVDKKEFKKGFFWALATTGGLSLVLFLSPDLAGSFSSPMDSVLYGNFPDWLLDGIIADRKTLLKMDAFRSLIIILTGAGLLYLWFIKKIKVNIFLVLISLLILGDLWLVDKRYLNSDNFVSKREIANPFPEMPVDEIILRDKDLSFRVLSIQNPFQDARDSYFHKSVGGYHAAKLRRYNELIDNQLIPEVNTMITTLRNSTSADTVFGPLSAINMMNTRYIIYDLNSPPIGNPFALGNAWFVANYKIMANADEEIAALKTLDASQEALIDKRFSENIINKSFDKDENGFIELTEYQPNYLKYSTQADSEQLTVFSEIYYEKGWNAYLNGEKVPHFRVNYVLRGMVIPAGNNTVEFKFEPKSYYMGNNVSLAGSILFLVVLFGFGYTEIRKKLQQQIKPDENNSDAVN